MLYERLNHFFLFFAMPGDKLWILPERIIAMSPAEDVPLPDAALVRAMGGALSIFATLLTRRGIADMSELADLLGLYAVATSQADEAEGMILGCWAGMLKDVAEHQDEPSDNDRPT
ncbi:hypothetical protein NUH86_22640 (plasmid) [Sphingobium sp. JS3065]|nr:hypothetical protein [Sphingobium sp. JS3065]UZW58070.1 hypothetical protein NUH86_22640 [Sphingobium sp. JS3065]